MRAGWKTVLLALIMVVIVFLYAVVIHGMLKTNPQLGWTIFWIMNAIIIIGIVAFIMINTKGFSKPVNYSDKLSMFFNTVQLVFRYVFILAVVALIFAFLLVSLRSTLVRFTLGGVFVFFYGILFYTIIKLIENRKRKEQAKND